MATETNTHPDQRMPRPQPEKTLADYVAIAISPLLIMLLVGSLAFFLLEITYSGQSSERLRWILFWFVLGSVLVARIAIEQGSGYAAAYGLALGAATSLVIFRLVESFPIAAIVLLGVIWWCTNKLTWDCTLIDEKEDASGEGLLQVAGLSQEEQASAEPRNGDEGQGDREESGPRDEPPAKRPHAPGLWVVYFSLAALPLFGLGQALIPRAEGASRAYAFRLLWIYVAAGMGLLLTTSFLGLRRYLRQRKLTMPAAMTGTWLLMGTMLAVAILVLCLLLPRPEAEYSFNTLVDQLASKAVEASRFAPAADDAGEGEGRRAGKPDEEGKQSGEDEQQGRAGKGGQQTGGEGEPQGEGKGEKSGESKQQGEQKGGQSEQGEQAGEGEEQVADQQQKQEEKKAGERQAGGGDQQQNQDARQAAAGEEKKQENGQKNGGSTDPSQTSSALEQITHAGEWIGTLVKWLIYGAIAVALLFFVIRNRESIGRFLRQFWADLWSLFGRRETASGAPARDNQFVERPQPFAAFANPFSTGMAQQMSPEQLVQYTFEALEAWAYEQGEQRPAMETPLEFTRRLAGRFPSLSREVRQFAGVYAELAYAKQTPSPEKSLPSIERLWRRLSAGPQVSELSAVSEGR